jgi:hypothetical protein
MDIIFLSFCYLTILSLLRIFSISDRLAIEYEMVCGINISTSNQYTWRKPAQVSFFPPKIPHDLTEDQTQALALTSQQITV